MSTNAPKLNLGFNDIHQILGISRVIPVVSIEQVSDAVPLARALLAGDVAIIEVTLRTPAAIDAIAAIVKDVPDMCVGAGTVWTSGAASQVHKAGAEFIVSPGRSDAVFDYCKQHDLPILPGAQTASEIAVWVERGLEAVKFFPAEVAGGVKALKAFSSVFGDLKFCPTGGISSDSADDYLALPAVTCVGGSWLVSKEAVSSNNWDSITAAARRVGNVSATNANTSDQHSSSPPWD